MTLYDNPDEVEPVGGRKSLPAPVIVTISVVLGFILLVSVLWILGVFTSAGEQPTGTAPFVQILKPASGASFLVSEPVLIEGKAGGLVENSLLVQVLDENNKILVEAPTTIQLSGVGVDGEGTWSVQVIVMAEPDAPGFVRVFAESPADGRIVAEDRVPVQFDFNTVEAYIDLVEPPDGTVLDTSSAVVVSGMAAGLFEGSLVVDALDQDGNLLAQMPAVIDAPDAGIGGEGPWQVELMVDAQPGTQGSLHAYAVSPKDGSLLVEDWIQVTFGEAALALPAFIEILEPQEGVLLDASVPVSVSGKGGGLFEGNVVVEALDAAGDVLAVEATTIQSPDAGIGGEGSWTVTLDIPAAPATQITLHAFSFSPADGAIMAEDSVGLIYGQEEILGEKPPLETTAWQLISMQNQPLLEGSMVWVVFQDGTLNGSAGCNNTFASYSVDGVALSIGAVATTRQACPEPQGLMDQENTYTLLLENTTSYAVEGSQLYLSNDTGDIILVYTAAVLGTVGASEDSQMPDGSTVEIILEDVSLADAPALTIAAVQQTGILGFPFPFVLPYDLEKIDPRMSYAVRVRISDLDGALIYTSASAYPVLTPGNPLVVDVLVEGVR